MFGLKHFIPAENGIHIIKGHLKPLYTIQKEGATMLTCVSSFAICINLNAVKNIFIAEKITNSALY